MTKPRRLSLTSCRFYKRFFRHVCSFEGTKTFVAQWLSWLERRPVTAEVESSNLFWVASAHIMCAELFIKRGLSSAGRAPALQAGGHRFEPCRPHHKYLGGFPSGQRGQTVNLLATPSKVRILLHPLAILARRCGSIPCFLTSSSRGRAC